MYEKVVMSVSGVGNRYIPLRDVAQLIMLCTVYSIALACIPSRCVQG